MAPTRLNESRCSDVSVYVRNLERNGNLVNKPGRAFPPIGTS
jgi:hypothetical protein